MMYAYKRLWLAKDVNSVTVRKAEKRDLPSISQLAIQLIRTLNKKEYTSLRLVSRNSRRLLCSTNSYFMVAEIGSTIAGVAHFTTRRTLTHRSPSGLIDELVVAEGFRRAGIGRRLLLATVERCRQLGCCEIEVSTEKTNKKAREFYKSCGFEERGILLEKDLE
jgi:N-acetylglutamate synthase-like GNAT family acetyltransferase